MIAVARSQFHVGRVALFAALLGVCLIPPAWAFTGSLVSTAGGVAGTGNWVITGPTEIRWSVTESSEGWWHYSYEFSHPVGPTSLFILEASTTLTESDIFNVSGEFGSYSVGTFNPGGDQPNMPGSIYGIKFAETWDYSTQIAFDSYRTPVWGDFYSRNGYQGRLGQNTAWNAGFLEIDPSQVPADGSLAAHILIPDTYEYTTPPNPVPEPASLCLLGLGLLGTAFVVRRRNRR